MYVSKFLYFLFFLFPFTYSETTTCPNSRCEKNNGLNIRFPFRLNNHQQKNCSYPGFDLTCNDQKKTEFKFPYGADFFVRSIDYVTQQVQLYDPGNCLPQRYLNLRLDLVSNLHVLNSPFKVMYYQNYSFLRCPSQLVKSRYTIIDCLSNSTTSFLATSSIAFAKSMSSSCDIVETLPIPVSLPVKFDDPFPNDLRDDLRLTWNAPDCRDCEIKGGVCGLNSNKSHGIGCFDKIDEENKTSGAPKVFRIIAMSITIPAMFCTLSVVLFICFFDRDRFIRRTTNQVSISPQQTIIISTGLDDSTIESYTKLVLGESGRVPGPNDGTCPICLADYSSKEIVRCIPDCKHCFHASCIDEWLRMNSSCPVCRNSPSHAHV